MRKLTRLEKILLAAVACLGVALVCASAVSCQSAAGQQSEPKEEATPTPEPTPDLDVTNVSLEGKKIIVDAGHGGPDQGCTGVDGRLEKEVNLEIAKRLESMLESEGVTVIMTRETDDAIGPTKEADMEARKQIILDSNADAFVSIHQNQFEGEGKETMSGPQVFFAYQGTAGKKLAVAIQDMLNYELDVENPRMALDVPYDILKPGSQASCTVECGFFSNPEEEALLQTPEYQEKLVNAITDGLKLFFKRTAP